MHASLERIEVCGRNFKQSKHLRGNVLKTIESAAKNVSLMESLEEG